MNLAATVLGNESDHEFNKYIPYCCASVQYSITDDVQKVAR